MLEVCLLGTGGMMPLPYRWLTSLMDRFNGKSILIDCGEGTQIAMKEKGWSPKPIDVICFTLFHADHISGPGVMARRYHNPGYTTGGTAEAISRMKNMKNLPEDTFLEIVEDQDFHIRDLTIHPFSIPHDAAQPVGYRVECEDKAVGIATDLGKYNDYIVDYLQNLDALLLEANHDIRMLQVGSYPYYLKQRILGDRGHLSNENAGKLLCRLLHDDMKAVFLGHLS